MSRKLKLTAGALLLAGGVASTAVADELTPDAPSAPQAGQIDPKAMNDKAPESTRAAEHRMDMMKGHKNMMGSEPAHGPKHRKRHQMGGCC